MNLFWRDRAGIGIVDADRNLRRFVVGEYELREAGENDKRVAEFTPLVAIHIAFLLPEHIERTDERRALSAIVVEAQELESCILLGAEVALYLVLVAECLELSTCHEEIVGLGCHAVVGEQVAENLEVACLIDSVVLMDFLEVGECAPLSLLVGNDRVGVH